MSTVEALQLETPLPLAGVPVSIGRRRRRTLGAVLAQAQMTEVAAFEFAGGTAAVFSDRSPAKATPNEDSAALWPTKNGGGILAIADGLGGHAGGERASRLAIEVLQKYVQEALALPDDGQADSLRGAILNGIEAANQSVRELGCGAATTLALVEIQGRSIRPYHVGDSVILLTGQRGKLKLQTIPHSPIGYAVEAGLMKEEEAIHHEERHVISNVIGAEQMRIEMSAPVEMALRDTLVLASDGLLDNLLPGEIVEIVRSGPLNVAVSDLVTEAHHRMTSQNGSAPSKPDDLTIIAYRPC
ncbi:MAG TPA: protein phosphatase 2C domain-containing protein [Lacipirellulaceae bacterium]|nr:protein phosphatase 2C domain-containing protein [Lacipirellulaceae bacterium]